MILRPLIEIFNQSKFEFSIITLFCLTILFLICVCSYDDIMNQSIVFWKLFLTGLSTTLLPFIYVLIFGDYGFYQKLGYGLSVIIYIFLLYLNIRFNRDGFIGKGDIDIIAGPFALTIGATIWQVLQNGSSTLSIINLTYIWFNFAGYVTVGLVISFVVFSIWAIIKLLTKKLTVKTILKDTRIPMIPSLIVISIMMPYILMVF